MLNIANITTAQSIRIPIMYLPQANSWKLVLRSVVDNETKYNASLMGVVLGHGYVTVTVTLPAGLPDGEYTYALHCGTDTVGAGLATVGDYKHTPTKYNETIQYKQYAN